MGSAEGFSSRFWSLIGATFLGFLGIGTVLPRLGPHLRGDLGGSDQTVGFVIGIFSFVALAGRFISGPLADRRGRKIAFQTGLLSCAVAGAAYLLPLGIAGAYLGRCTARQIKAQISAAGIRVQFPMVAGFLCVVGHQN